MIITPSSFTLEYLTGLKFKELQKLSSQYNVNKRWAKKQELIENLLALREKYTATVDKEQDEEWKDANTIFNDTKQNNGNDGNRRLTFTISSKSSSENGNSRLTYDVPQNGKSLIDEINTRETYEIPPIEPLLEARATFGISSNNKLNDEIDPRATFSFCQNGEKLLEMNKSQLKGGNKVDFNSIKSTKDFDFLGKTKFDLVITNGKEKEGEKTKPQVKMLTIPCARVGKRNAIGNDTKTDSVIKMSKRSINIKKSTRLPVGKQNLLKSPGLSCKKSVTKPTIPQSLVKTQPRRGNQSKLPVRLQFNDKDDEINKENVKKNSKKTMETSSLNKTLPRRSLERKLNLNATPGVKPPPKPLTAIKMPDFSKIHKRQFDQMDSLHDYLKKKEERIKRLFGTPQPGQRLQVLNKTAPVFHFQSSALDKKNKESDDLKTMATPFKKKESNTKTQKEGFISKLPPSKLRTDIKDKNRSHIHGVRTNKRFELQMKLRNL